MREGWGGSSSKRERERDGWGLGEKETKRVGEVDCERNGGEWRRT